MRDNFLQMCAIDASKSESENNMQIGWIQRRKPLYYLTYMEHVCILYRINSCPHYYDMLTYCVFGQKSY